MGPDHLGYVVPTVNVNASLHATRPLVGNIALLCQSAAITRSVIDWATSCNIGFSHVISVGMRWDVDFGDLMDYLLRDGNTRAILMYMENTRNRRKFVSAARAPRGQTSYRAQAARFSSRRVGGCRIRCRVSARRHLAGE
ncbi:MAG: hypothetical protein IPK63_02085 [Candidatus Competibacteraceae bacterium]|nr:hypothetical protein [Candidatus Competibacteraceae bacterium]